MLRDLGLPTGDRDSEESGQRFPDGCHFRIEVPSVNSVECAARILSESVRRGFTINRLTETLGSYRHTAAQVREYVKLGEEYGVEILMSVGPRATYDIGATVQTRQGVRIGYRLRGQDQVVRALEDVRRAVDLGVRGFVVYDEGLLSVLGELRSSGKLPADLSLKVSAHCGHGNPASARLLERLGADSFNPVRDLTLPMVGALRSSISIPIDIHVDNPHGSGGFVRTFDAPEFVRIAAPVHLKTGNSALDGHGVVPTMDQVESILTQVEIVSEFVDRYLPSARQSPNAKRAHDDSE
ncbi:U32 family peptidase [Actinoallomurus rhizosphaericola]|uniref:U32 family peptidase n=1 Tax=Actinoallomurus rhizosphaericola TaxID=2952536 RepID=UPI0020928FA2|nr:U32 family peptidase [Actinoallomurus rhizosphaericola]MCO5997991.1 U32 family peptidase [Actinoallomurus rhizosphaericola]